MYLLFQMFYTPFLILKGKLDYNLYATSLTEKVCSEKIRIKKFSNCCEKPTFETVKHCYIVICLHLTEFRFASRIRFQNVKCTK